ncbi:hypothetical protein, partial [Xanthomonas citri]|uniref:hypothetical protein n=1 Tax=Xanthomonas citri TaxID=346 RepID=UPI0030C7BF21
FPGIISKWILLLCGRWISGLRQVMIEIDCGDCCVDAAITAAPSLLAWACDGQAMGTQWACGLR